MADSDYTDDGVLVDTTLRFQGVEGETWLIRAVSSGASVTHDDVVAKVDAFISRCAVDAAAIADAPAGTVISLTDPPGGLDAESGAVLGETEPAERDSE